MENNSSWMIVWNRFKKNKFGILALFIVLIFINIALYAPLIANKDPFIYIDKNQNIYFPFFYNHDALKDIDLRNDKYKDDFAIFPLIKYNYSEYDLDSIVEQPTKKHILGTDEQGRDLAARMVHGTRVSILVGFLAVFIYVAIGIILGALAGYYGGWADVIISRFIEIMICFPTLFLILTILALWGPSLISVMIVIGITGWTGIARIVRGEFLRLREADFILASKTIGCKDSDIIFTHILPNSLAPVLVSATFGIAATILIESSLSFLGFGVQPPTPSWGDILSQSRDFIDFAWWLTTIPGIAIFLTITSYNLVGEAFQEALDPKAIKK